MRHSIHLPVLFFLIAAGGVLGCTPKGGAGAGAGAGTAPAPGVVGDPAHNLLKASTFEDGVMLPWMTSFSAPATGSAEVKNGALCLRVDNPGQNRWDAQIRHREMTIQKGHSYVLSFKAWASRPTKFTYKIGMSGPPYTDYSTKGVDLTTTPQQFGYPFTMSNPDDATAELAFHAGGHMVQGTGPVDLCFDDVILSDPTFTPPPPPPAVPLPKIRVNQVGYLPKLTKIATLVTDATDAQDWQLLDAAGKVVASGKTTPYGLDATSGDRVHVVDFSSFKTPGRGYVLKSGDAQSDPFAIERDVYDKLKIDALRYFYHNRSGVEIKMPYAGGEQWARPAGHPSDKAPCMQGSGCSYTLDVTGGWYDAGDHGKYLVSAGMTVWTLLNWYERVQYLHGDASAFADGTLNIPESGNRIPDILDEVRWELEWEFKMQVPQGQPLAGMVHHKIHDDGWTALGTAPHEDKMTRSLHPPSTAATLNFIANMAQAARVWKKLDPAFSARCLKAAEAAWAAAKKNPAVFAPITDSNGGGAYDDKFVGDEWYWAAAEMFVTTGKPEYKNDVTSSPFDAKFNPYAGLDGGGPSSAMTWQVIDSLGHLTLATVPSALSKTELARYRSQVESAADLYAKIASEQGYRVPLKPGPDGKYPWGSNSSVLANVLVVALAYDFNPKPEYLDTVELGMDYVLGRNAMGRSYITGYGARPIENPHHRFWAHQANPSYPMAPPGAVAGGANSGLEDPYVQAAGLKGCAPQKCYLDHIEAWSANEITINWNAPLAWVAAWLDEHGRK
jgi:endoglucanase